NVRPIPFTPVLINDAEKPVLWGTNKDGLLCQLGYFDENPAPETVAKKQTFLRHKAPLNVIDLIIKNVQIISHLTKIKISELIS
ncbi:hypothetical protein, partial [Aliivibrio sp. 1S128]|uniref:hypothetical protein n=1 Tax=Aliivibrio sp. 1S128 TaxID=1840085 RepID=UPI000A7C3DC0